MKAVQNESYIKCKYNLTLNIELIFTGFPLGHQSSISLFSCFEKPVSSFMRKCIDNPISCPVSAFYKILMIADNPTDTQPFQIDQRAKVLSKLLLKEKFQVQSLLKKQFEEYMKRIQRMDYSSQRMDQSYQCLSKFMIASFNITDVYFPLITDPNFILIQSERQLFRRVQELKVSILKEFKSLCCSLTKGEVYCQSRNKEKDLKLKGLNSKIHHQKSVILTQWLLRNFSNPYPSNQEKEKLAGQSNLSVSQVNNWFINTRQRVVKKYMRKDIHLAEKGAKKKRKDEY